MATKYARTGWSVCPLKVLEQMVLGLNYDIEESEKENISYYFTHYNLIASAPTIDQLIKNNPELLL